MDMIWNFLLQSVKSSSGPSSDGLVPRPHKRAKFDASSSTEAPQRAVLPKLTKINDSVFEVYAPQQRRPSVEIVFFHGLQIDGSNQAHMNTWLSRDQSELWLYWILEKIPNARLLTISYDAHARKSSGEGVMELYKVKENLVFDLVDAEVGQDGCPVVLVGHCVGGLVMKEVCVKANSILAEVRSFEASHIRVRNFLQHLKGLFFFASPHHGTRLADKSTSSSKGFLFEDVGTSNNHAARRNEKFRKLRIKYGWRAFGLGEGRESHLVTPYLGTFTGFIVAEASARNDVDGFYTDTTADHFEVCQPHSRQSSSFGRLSDFVCELVKEDKARQGHKIENPDSVIGLQDRVNSVLQELKQAPRLGIVGIGGIGKTTLAKTVYNTISHRFEYSCFLPEVKKVFADEETPGNLRAAIIKDLYWKERKVPEDFTWSELQGKSVLIVLDDAKTASQVRVMTNLDGFLEESRVIATSRDAGFLRIEEFKCRSADCLNFEDSKKLFCLHAFRESDTLNGLEKHLERIVNKCAGLPLALKVAGRYLFDRPKDLWDGAFGKLSRAQSLNGTAEDGLWSVLMVSYNSLAPAEQEVFLDVATFFHGQSLNTAKKIWKLCGWEDVESSWQNLLDKGFVAQVPRDSFGVGAYTWGNFWTHPWADNYINDLRSMGKLDQLQLDDEGVGDYIIQMHEVLRDLGRSKACPDPRYVLDHSRVSYNVVNLAPLWLSNQGQPKVEVLEISNRQGDGNSIFMNTSRFHGLKCLRILTLEGGSLEGSLQLFPRTLKCLKLKNFHCSNQSSSHELEQHESLQYLEIESCLGFPMLFDCPEQLHDLKHLSISHCGGLQVLPSLQSLQSLEHLEIKGCRSLGTLGDVIGQLTALRYLDVTSHNASDAPLDNLGRLKALEYLRISEKKGYDKEDYWEALPDSLGELISLKELILDRNKGLEELPKTLGALPALGVLVLDSCGNLKTLPETLGQLQALQTLRVHSEALETLPDSLGQLRALRSLMIKSEALGTLPDSLGQLRALQNLTIACSMLEILPDSLGQLRALQALYIDAPLRALPDTLGSLQALEFLRVCVAKAHGGAIRMESLPDALGGLHVLKHLELGGIDHVKSLPQTLGGLVALEHLRLSGCNERCVADIPSQLPALEELEIFSCYGFRVLPETVGHLETLKTLRLIYCGGLETVPDSLGQLESLEHLDIEYCPKLKDLPDSLKQRGFTLSTQKDWRIRSAR